MDKIRLTPLKAHRIRCLKCHANSYKAIRECEDNDCESHEFRFGHNPCRKGIGGRMGKSSTIVSKSDSVKKPPTQDGSKSVQRIVTDGKFEIIVRKIEKNGK